jgi:hypothetical protein
MVQVGYEVVAGELRDLKILFGKVLATLEGKPAKFHTSFFYI